MRFSVVINTCNRGNSLQNTLKSLRQQTHSDFEVLVVVGPSTDNTAEILRNFAGDIRVFSCEERRLAISRNIGVVNSTGDIVAFIDDDSLATPTWLEDLNAVYEREDRVGAAGGLVYDQTGVSLQYRFVACNRDGSTLLKVEPPLERFLHPKADPVAYLQGTNMSFRRSTLQEIGGFDENIRHFYDDVDTCLRVIDAGYELKPLDSAAVHHKVLASHVRDHRRITLDPFNLLSDRIYFGIQHGREGRSTRALMDSFVEAAQSIRCQAGGNLNAGLITTSQRDYIYSRVEEAFEDGMAKGYGPSWAGHLVPEVNERDFLPFPTIKSVGPRRRICFISKEYPPGDFGGPGRYTHELAGGFAAAGHEVHVITKSHDICRIDLEEGAWIHRLPPTQPHAPELDKIEAKQHVFDMVDVHREIGKLHDERPIDIVLSPLWLCEALGCIFDKRFPTAITLITAMKAVSSLAAWARASDGPKQLVRFEEQFVEHGQYLHAVSTAIRDRAVEDYNADINRTFIAPLGIRDRRDEFTRKRPTRDLLRILYVGRLETRKGADVFIEAATRLGREFSNVEFVLAGKELPTDQGDTHRKRFELKYADEPELSSRITFTGMVTDDELYQHYADCDIFCLPTHYESFGLVFVEAMMWGKPLVGSRVGGVPEVVAHDEQGFLCEVNDVDAITDALRQLIVDPEMRNRFGLRSRELYEQKWALPVTIANMEVQLEEVVQQHQARHGTDRDGPPRWNEIQSGFASVLTAALGITPEAAKSVSVRLFDPSSQLVDIVTEFRARWHDSPENFVTACYQLLLERNAVLGEMSPWLDGIKRGMTKLDVLRIMLESQEADRWNRISVERLLPVDLLTQPHFGSSATDAADQSATIRIPIRRPLLARIPYLGVGFRYLRRCLYLPWNFQKVFETNQQVMQTVSSTSLQLAAIQSSTSSLTEELQILRTFAQEQRGRQVVLEQLVKEIIEGLQERVHANTIPMVAVRNRAA